MCCLKPTLMTHTYDTYHTHIMPRSKHARELPQGTHAWPTLPACTYHLLLLLLLPTETRHRLKRDERVGQTRGVDVIEVLGGSHLDCFDGLVGTQASND